MIARCPGCSEPRELRPYVVLFADASEAERVEYCDGCAEAATHDGPHDVAAIAREDAPPEEIARELYGLEWIDYTGPCEWPEELDAHET